MQFQLLWRILRKRLKEIFLEDNNMLVVPQKIIIFATINDGEKIAKN